MYNLLCPNQRANVLQDIDIFALQAKAFKGIIFDLDNTIIPWAGSIMQPEIVSWIIQLQQHGFKICIVSNNRHTRVQEIAANLGVPFVSRAHKPLKKGFRQALHILQLSCSEVVVIGDQLFTDVLGGNRLGLYTIWVKPMSSQEFITTQAVRWLEKIACSFLKLD